jgi:hypothetical protein
MVPKHSVYQPRTRLGRKLWEIRSQIIASGIPLLDWEGVEREIAAMRTVLRVANAVHFREAPLSEARAASGTSIGTKRSAENR